MTLSLIQDDTGFGIGSDIGVYRWNGHSFNPSVDSDYQSWNPWTEAWDGFYIDNITAAFDLSGFRYGNEAILAAVEFESDVDDSGYIYMDWYDPDSNLLFSFSLYFSIVTDEWYAAWSGIGVKAGGDEVWKNGTYTVEWSVEGNYNTISGSLYPVVSNYPGGTSTSGSTGALWVEGEELAFANYQGYKTLCHHDGTSSYVGTAYSGHIWLETNGKITYVDDDGYKRSTKMGDEYGWYPDPTELPGSGLGAYAGHIWVSNGDYTDTFLCIISGNGVKYRIGVGYALAGDYQ